MTLQSSIALLIGISLMFAADAPTASARRRLMWIACAIFLVCSWTFTLPPSEGMGDAPYYTESRARFDDLFVNSVFFSSHLAFATIGALDRAGGHTDSSIGEAFVWFSRLMGVWSVAMLLLVGAMEQWSSRALRYAGLVLAAPQALAWFGYREVGFACLNPAVYPLLMSARARRTYAAAVLSGIGAALHGFGLIGVAAAVTTLWWEQRRRIVPFVAIATAVWLLPLVAYWGLGRPITIGHATGTYIRPLFTASVEALRVNHPLLSVTGARDVILSAIIAGVPVLIPAAWRSAAPDVRTLLWYSAIPLICIVWLWFPQGLAREIDLLWAVFPAVFAALWLAAGNLSRTRWSFAVLAIGHVIAGWVFDNRAFVNVRFD